THKTSPTLATLHAAHVFATPHAVQLDASRGARRSGGPRRLRRLAPLVGFGERMCLGLGLYARPVAPLEQTLLQDVDVSDKQQHDEEHHLDVNQSAQTVPIALNVPGGRERLEDDRPRDEEDQFDVE